MATATMATSQRVFRIPPEISLDKINSYTCPPKMPAAILHDCRSAVTPSSKSEREREPADGEDEEHLVVIEDDGSDSDSEAEGSEADREGPELDNSPANGESNRKANTVGDLLPTPNKRKLDQLSPPNDIDYNSDNSAKDGTEGLRPQKQQKQPNSYNGSPIDRDTLSLHDRTGHNSGNNNGRINGGDGEHLSRPRTDSVTRSGSPQTSSPRAKARDGLSANTAYQIADVTLYPVPKALSIITAIVRCNKSKLPLDLGGLDTSILGEKGQIIRITQVSQDSWLLLGCRYDDGASDSRPRRSWTMLSADQKSNPHSDAANHDANHADNHMGEEDEDEDAGEDTTEYRPYAMGTDPRFNRGDMPFRKRTRVPWLESDDQRLLAYRNNMAMEWKDIFKRFPDRTPGAPSAKDDRVTTRTHLLTARSINPRPKVYLPKREKEPHLERAQVEAFDTPELQHWKDVKVRRQLLFINDSASPCLQSFDPKGASPYHTLRFGVAITVEGRDNHGSDRP
ncbi:uncharacterized protein BDZ99DRAFT_470961 [Mytilinidion resinicola]|uniref:Uncharacterized protein n=1 Tax=Mytilinidion resinicola TaxID=574789 RepID=A0A6A6Z453_9PEZI|nr:uncharacterized protein BDZ99DRAFT_470961 [Mytilinidion resinicola]KAF2815598.1 hypothetical protein BDZ99DRAFT_470961 [Mytilinidion resinicola]